MRQINAPKQLDLFKPTSKIILFIVDGNHDENEINKMLHVYCPKLFENYRAMFLACDENDITQRAKASSKNIVGMITEQLIAWRKNGGHQYVIYPSDIDRIIHIIDTDGAFIPRESVKKGSGKIKYTEDAIYCIDRDGIVGRNKRKTDTIFNRLITNGKIDNIPYSIWYVSCNMDHLLFGKQPENDKEKLNNEIRFRRECQSPEYLSQSIFADGIRAESTYEESWDFIKEAHNSLHRHCNINLLLDELKALSETDT